MRCDYIRAGFRGDSIFHEGEIKDLFPVRLIQLQKVLGGDWKSSKKLLNGYGWRFDLIRDGEQICFALSNGSGSAEGTHLIESAGHFSVEVKAAMDKVFGPAYSCARRDTCFDFIDDDDDLPRFHEICNLARSMGAQKIMTYDQMGQGWLGILGETMTAYMGSRHSPVMIRIYTRGRKTLKEGGVDDARRIRVEVEVKPGKRSGKEALALLSDEQLFGCAKWSKDFIEKLGIMGINRHAVGTVWKLSDKQRVFAHLVKQYGGLLEEILDQRGAAGLEKAIRDQRRVSYEVRETLRSLEIAEEVKEW